MIKFKNESEFALGVLRDGDDMHFAFLQSRQNTFWWHFVICIFLPR